MLRINRWPAFLIISLLLIGLIPSGVTAGEPDKGILYTKPLPSVIFTHQQHFFKGVTCATCHSGLFEMEALNAQTHKDFNMDSLYKGKYCGACHNGKKAFASDTQCARCHVGANATVPQKEVPAYKMSVNLGKGESGVVFNHEPHLKKAGCRNCHSSVFQPKEGADKISAADHNQAKYCFICHDQKGKNGFSSNDCSRCHKKSLVAPTEAIKYGKGDKAVVFKHEKHQLKAGCKACHPQTFAYRKVNVKIDFDDHTNRKACFICHAKKEGSATYNCNVCHKDKPAVTATSYPDTLKYKTKWQNVYFHHESHAAFACNECHNNPFAMNKGKTNMNMTEMLRGKTCGICHNGTKAFNTKECLKCHKK